VAIELAAVLVLRELAAGTDVRVALAPPAGPRQWLVVLLGAAVAVVSLVLMGQDLESDAGRRYALPDAWGVAQALLVRVAAVMAMPRRFGAALLGGWIAGTSVGVVYGVLAFSDASGSAGPVPVVAAGCLLPALAVAAVLLAREQPGAA
jgi:hypothetical protein